MKKLQQIVVQISNVDSERSILQYGDDFLPEEQRFIEYESLNEEDQTIWDGFVQMLVNQRVPDSDVRDRL
jgi:hypothetical protein